MIRHKLFVEVDDDKLTALEQSLRIQKVAYFPAIPGLMLATH
jgi:hypothetical protein